MSATQYQLVYEGEVEAGHDPVDVRQTLAGLFDFDDERQTRLFIGKPVILSEGMDEATAESFRQALAGTGAVTRIVAGNKVTADTAQTLRVTRRRIEAKRRAQVRDGAIVPDRRQRDDRRKASATSPDY